MNKLIIKIARSYKYRIISALILTFSVSAIFVTSLFRHKTADPIPKISFITREKQKELGPFTSVVKTGFYIKNISKADVINNNFSINGVVWFEFDPSEVMLSMVEKFSFLDGVIVQKAEPNIKMIGERVFVKYEVVVELSSDLRYHYYPYDSHRLPIILINDYVSTYEMFFITADANFNIDPSVSLSNWKVDDITTDYGYRTANFEGISSRKKVNYPLTLFLLEFSSLGIKNILVVFIPVLFNILLALFCLLIFYRRGEEHFDILTMASVALTSQIAFRFVLNTMMPNVGYSTVADNVYTTGLGVIFFVFFVVAIGVFYIRRKFKTPEEAEQTILFQNFVNFMFFIGLAIFVVTFLYNILLF